VGAPALSSLAGLLRSARALATLVHRPLTPERAMALVRTRMARRDRLFLQMVEEAIWPYPASPYRRLFEWAKWSPDRLAQSVRQRGLDATLQTLFDAGVYLRYEEFKGRIPIERAGLVLECTEADFDHPAVPAAFDFHTSGTRSQGSRVPASIEAVMTLRAPAWNLALQALGIWERPVVLWLPRASGFSWAACLLHGGRPAWRWFSLSDPSTIRARAPSAELFALMRAVALTRGLSTPAMRHVPPAQADLVLDAVLEIRARRDACTVVVSPSMAARLVWLARERGIALEHVVFIVGGEPLTPGKHQDITSTGAIVWPRYAIREFGAVGAPCNRQAAIDDVHFLTDKLGLVRDRRPLPDGRTVDALLLTSVLPSAMKIAINVDCDDFAEVTERRCGCLWDELGLHTHVAGIRSFSKLTGEGMTVLGTDCVRILEEDLPREFGGTSTDYQLLEAEDDGHRTRLYLVVNPSVGPVDEARVKARFIDSMRDPTRPNDLIPPLWRQADTIQVIRREPVRTAAGRLLPFHTLAAGPGNIAGPSVRSDERE
jgi:hypothetical protein